MLTLDHEPSDAAGIIALIFSDNSILPHGRCFSPRNYATGFHCCWWRKSEEYWEIQDLWKNPSPTFLDQFPKETGKSAP